MDTETIVSDPEVLHTVILEINAVFKKCNFVSHPSIHIIKKIIIFVNIIMQTVLVKIINTF